ncbi:MAG: hypothetical protein WAO95_03310 [Burkholderiales bacterium]
MTAPWFRDRNARSFVARRFLPWFAGLNLVWETLQIPLYTLWTESPAREIAFAIAHCTIGDVLIGVSALALVLTLTRAPAATDWRWNRIAALLALAGTGYTAFSEWMNTQLGHWTYSALMPTLAVGGIEIGVSPLAQWLVVPPAALYLARRHGRYG